MCNFENLSILTVARMEPLSVLRQRRHFLLVLIYVQFLFHEDFLAHQWEEHGYEEHLPKEQTTTIRNTEWQFIKFFHQKCQFLSMSWREKLKVPKYSDSASIPGNATNFNRSFDNNMWFWLHKGFEF